MIFSRFGLKGTMAEIVWDKDTGDYLCHAFVEFLNKEVRNEAYVNKESVLVENRRIKFNLSQRFSKVWNMYIQRRRGGSPAAAVEAEAALGGRRCP